MFKLTSQFEPTGDQPEAIKELTQGLLDEAPGLQFDRMPDEEAVHRIHDVFRKVDHDPVVRLPLGL